MLISVEEVDEESKHDVGIGDLVHDEELSNARDGARDIKLALRRL